MSVCLSVPPQISGTGGRIATLLNRLEDLRLASCTNCFSSLYNVWFRKKKPLDVFRQLRAESLARAVTLLVTLGMMNLDHYNKAVGTFSKDTRSRTRPPYHGYPDYLGQDESCLLLELRWNVLKGYT